jgi:RNA polymerase sigma-70 factor (ECF subfamily)
MPDTVENMAPDEEIELIRKAKQGDAAAFGTIYDRHVTRIYRFILLKLGNPGDAEDLTHEVFLAAWRTIGNYEERNGIRPVSWLYRIAGNRVIDHYRSKKYPVSLDELIAGNALPMELVTSGSANLAKALSHKMDFQEVMMAVRDLTDDQQNVIIMRFVEDLTPEETGQAMGKSAAAVRLIQHRALEKLRKSMEHRHEEQVNRRTA